ncbi:MAG: cytochrome C oxidase subunit IV family protein [Deltaproteobacteria bacterium]
MSNASHDHAHAPIDDGRVHAHVSSFGFMLGIFMALIALTVITVGASYVDFGSASPVIAVLIATVKASLVALFFMHLRHDRPFHGLIFVMAFVFLGIFLVLTLDDVGTRGRIDDSAGVQVNPRTGEAAPGGIDPEQAFAAHRGHGAHAAAPAAQH